MMIDLQRLKIERSDKQRWHKKLVFLRTVKLGGYSTGASQRTVFVVFARLWARKSVSHGRWLFTEHRPARGLTLADWLVAGDGA
jgi:hypothetical protein